MAQAVSYQTLTREAKVQSQASSCGTCGTTAGIYPNTLESSIIDKHKHMHLTFNSILV